MPHQITEDCLGCKACVKVCPVFAIQGDLRKKHAINRKRCVDCGVCGRVCPKHAVVDSRGEVVETLARSNWLRPAIQAARCTKCVMCVDICARGALALIQISSDKISGSQVKLVDEKNCVGCALCARICPMGVIQMEERR